MGNSDEVRQRVLRKIEELKRRGLVGTKQPERKEPEEDTLIYKGVHRDFTAVPNIFYHCGKAISDGELRLWGTLISYAVFCLKKKKEPICFVQEGEWSVLVLTSV